MRIFILILTLILSVAFVFLNILGFNGMLSLNEFFLVNIIAEVLACFVLGHFMFRTYANRKKLKKLQQEVATRQASAVAQEQSERNQSFMHRPAESVHEEPAPQQQPAASTTAHIAQEMPTAAHTPQASDPRPPQATQPMKPISQDIPDMDATTLYKTPLGK